MGIFDWTLARDNFWFILSGLRYTLMIAGVSFILGTLLGLVIALMRLSKYKLFQGIAKLHVSLMRGVPLLVVLFLLYFGLPYIKIQFSAITCSLIAFSVSSSAYISEILRSSISAIDTGQWEAARSLGLSYIQTFEKVILPQSFRISVPPLTNVLLDLIKGSSLSAMITVPEIFQNAKIVGGREYDYMTMYIVVALIYWGVCLLFEKGQRYLETKVML